MQSSNEGILNRMQAKEAEPLTSAKFHRIVGEDTGSQEGEHKEAVTVELSPEQTEEFTKGIMAAYFDYYEKYKSHRTARRKLGKKINMDPKDIRTIVLLNT